MRVLRFILETSKSYRLYLWGICCAICIVSIDANIKPFLVKLLIDAASNVGDSNVWDLVIVYAISQTLMMLAWALSDWCAIRINSSYRADIVHQLTEKIGHYSYHFFQNHLAGSISAKINDVFTLIPRIIFTITHQFLQFGLTALIVLFFLMRIHAFFAISLFLWISWCLFFTYVSMKRGAPLTNTSAESKSTIWGHVSDYLTNMLNVRLFATSAFEMNRLNAITQDFVKKTKKQESFMMKFYIIQGVIISVYTTAFLFWLILLQNRNLITPGDFALVFILNFKMFDNYMSSHINFVNLWLTGEQLSKH